MKKKNDVILARIEVFNETQGGGVMIRKAARGYSLFRENTGQPVARMRPTGRGGSGRGDVVAPRQVGPDW